MIIHRFLPSLSVAVMLVICIGAATAHAASDQDETSMPATESQSEALKETPDGAGDTRTDAKSSEAGDMPATQSQQESLEESDDMSDSDDTSSGSGGATATDGADATDEASKP